MTTNGRKVQFVIWSGMSAAAKPGYGAPHLLRLDRRALRPDAAFCDNQQFTMRR
jgi:hypothetical protein